MDPERTRDGKSTIKSKLFMYVFLISVHKQNTTQGVPQRLRCPDFQTPERKPPWIAQITDWSSAWLFHSEIRKESVSTAESKCHLTTLPCLLP